MLVESLSRKCAFLREAAAAMGLDERRRRRVRARRSGRTARGACDVVTARALASLPVVYEYAAPLLRDGGVVVAWKGEVTEAEAADGAARRDLLGLEEEPPLPVRPFAGSERRTLWSRARSRPRRPTSRAGPGLQRNARCL